MSKGEGRYVGIKFTEELIGDISGNESAFAIAGKEYKYVNGPLIDKEYQVKKVERYPAGRLYQDNFENGIINGVKIISEGINLDTGGAGGGYTDDLTGGLTYISTSDFSSSYANHMAFDNSIASSWSASGTVGQAVGVDFGTSRKISKLRIMTNGRLKNFDLEGSNDNSTWTVIYSGIQLSNSNWQEYIFENSMGYRFYRVKCTGSLYTGSNVMITEIEMMESLLIYVEEGIFETVVSSIELPEIVRLGREVNLPQDTSIIVEYAYSNSDIEIPEIWTVVEESNKLITIDADFLWLKYTLATKDNTKTPTLHKVWLEEADAPQDTIFLTFDQYERFHNADGNISVEYDMTKGNLKGLGGFVESFSTQFSPADLIQKLNPNVIEHFEIIPSVSVDFQKVEYIYRYAFEHFEITPSVNLNFEFVGVINP